MIKVVYNACFGGFGLSEKAIRRLAALGHKGAKRALKEPRSFAGKITYYTPSIERHDPLLVRVVEELGTDASDSLARLEIAKVEGKRYRIDEYDGSETVYGDQDDPGGWIEVEE